MAQRSSAIFIYITVALDALGFGIVVPVVPALVKHVAHVQDSEASFWVGLLLTTYSAMQFLFAPLLGGLSDKLGRKPVLLGSLVGLCVGSLATAVAPTLFLLVAVRMATGAVSGNAAAAEAYIADITTKERRAKRYGLIGAVYGVAFIIGPAIGGFIGSANPRLPFYASAALAACNLVYGLFLLPESLPSQKRRALDWKRINPFASLWAMFANREMAILGTAWCCLWFSLGAQQSSFILANEMRFGWNTFQNGLVLALAGSVSAVTQGFLVQPATRKVGAKSTALLGLGFSTLGYGCYAFAVSQPTMFVGVVVLGLGAFGNPAIQAIVTARASDKHQGEANGSLTSLQGLMAALAPFSTGWLFTLGTQPGGRVHFPGAPFLLATVICAGGLANMMRLRARRNG